MKCSSSTGKRAGRTAQRKGELHEGKVLAICAKYRQEGLALISKRPTPYVQIGGIKPCGKFMAKRVATAGVDFNGVLKGGRAIAFDVKGSGTAGLPLNQHDKPTLKAAQADELRRVHELGGVAGVLIRTQVQRVGRPETRWCWMSWPAWQRAVGAVKAAGGASIGAKHLAEYATPCPTWRGVPDWLDAALAGPS